VYTLRFIKRARELGFSIERIRRLLDLWQNKSRASRDVKRLALDHIAEIRAKIAAMISMRDAVQGLLNPIGVPGTSPHRTTAHRPRELTTSA
jgi:MerR family copper efflux transcriptional regulator